MRIDDARQCDRCAQRYMYTPPTGVHCDCKPAAASEAAASEIVADVENGDGIC